MTGRKTYTLVEKNEYHRHRKNDHTASEDQREYSWRWCTALQLCKLNRKNELASEVRRKDIATINAIRSFNAERKSPRRSP